MHLTARKRIALGLADALLAGERDAAPARARCEQALGSRARWIGKLVETILPRFSENWRDTSRDALAQAIDSAREYDRAWRAKQPPRLRSFPVAPPHMAPMPRALIDCVVPDLPTSSDIARWLDLSIDELTWLTGPLGRPLHDGSQATHYSYRWLPKRSGGVRLLEVPKAQLRAIQRQLLHRLLEFIPPHEAAHGFRERHSCVTNARPHVGQALVMRMDLTDFFGSIGGGKVYNLFVTLGYPAAAARALTRLTTTATPPLAWSAGQLRSIVDSPNRIDWQTRKRLGSPHLPQGAPTSPALANLCAFNFDVRVQALAEKFGVRYTRYADDLTFSGGDALARRSHAFEAHVSAIAIEAGFRINHRKTLIQRAATRQRVTGIVVNRTTNLPREHYDRLKATLHNCLGQGPASQCYGELGAFRNHLAGHIAHLSAIHPARGARLRGMYDRIHWG